MVKRAFGRPGRSVSELSVGMLRMGGGISGRTGAEDRQSTAVLQAAVPDVTTVSPGMGRVEHLAANAAAAAAGPLEPDLRAALREPRWVDHAPRGSQS